MLLTLEEHVRLPVDVALGVENPQTQYRRDSWVEEHHHKLLYAYALAAKHIARAAEHYKKHYDRQARVLPLAPGERVWRRTNRVGDKGKLCGRWDPDP